MFVGLHGRANLAQGQVWPARRRRGARRVGPSASLPYPTSGMRHAPRRRRGRRLPRLERSGILGAERFVALIRAWRALSNVRSTLAG